MLKRLLVPATLVITLGSGRVGLATEIQPPGHAASDQTLAKLEQIRQLDWVAAPGHGLDCVTFSRRFFPSLRETLPENFATIMRGPQIHYWLELSLASRRFIIDNSMGIYVGFLDDAAGAGVDPGTLNGYYRAGYGEHPRICEQEALGYELWHAPFLLEQTAKSAVLGLKQALRLVTGEAKQPTHARAELARQHYENFHKATLQIERDKSLAWPADHNLNLARRLISHDLGGRFACLYSYFRELGADGVQGTAELAAEMAMDLRFLRAFGSSLGFVSTGNPFWERRMPAEATKSIARQCADKEVSLEFPAGLRLTTAEFAALHQPVKNARAIHLTNGISDQFHVRATGNATQTVYEVIDHGPGIHTKEGSPLPPEQFGKLFGSFSSKASGGGLGLQVAKRITDLKGGQIEVESTYPTGRTVYYSTQTKQPRIQVHKDRAQGTRVRLILPRPALFP